MNFRLPALAAPLVLIGLLAWTVAAPEKSPVPTIPAGVARIEGLDEERDPTDAEKATLDRHSREVKNGTVTALTLDQLEEQVSANRE